MKKKSCLTLALILVIVQVVSLFAVLPVSAEALNRSYDIYKTDAEIAVDGVADEAWENVSYSETFVANTNPIPEGSSGFEAKLKALWSPVTDDDTKINVYFLLTVKDPTSNVTGDALTGSGTLAKWAADTFSFGCSYGDGNCWTGQQPVQKAHTNESFGAATAQSGVTYPIKLGIVDNRQAEVDPTSYYTVEIGYQLPKTGSVFFDFWVQDTFVRANATSSYIRYSWSGIDVSNPVGVGKIVDAPITVNTTPGASIRIDTSEKATSGIRFVSSVDMTRYNALVAEGATITTGTLIVPTENLTKKSITGSFTKEALTTAGLTENTHFYDIVNVGNEWVSGNNGTWYATLYNIQDYTREFTAVGYVTVTIGDETTTYYGIPSESRSIAQVAQTLMSGETEGEGGAWTAAQEAVLKSFFTQGE